ncbi:hypothetical protein [Flammeovirga kamogawensis]|uniref:Acyloxyacyl hydrolase n=1 Tax=Flammeovirga kamogawensis TaxID=373891 RepID=A0ABX8H4K0_9BACT|nr:hypothetical protein [Flammeovirga kamogawensis]MBB6461857.1 outer membrane protein W [Flammeovirga kamogawensis]QWG10529.1 hypothetical protein KM029_26510 [Flammeovirga kamogawensis]TRX63638.1 hypothetical protein EO216_24785 [Flammeovirga kamogawensis]
MRHYILFIVIIYFCASTVKSQDASSTKQRLDFAKMYLEVGGTYFPSFTGNQLADGIVSHFESSATINPYLTWGAFHFWGHTEFYVTFPLGQINLDSEHANHELSHSVATGARIYPWAITEGKLRPYIGLNWGAQSYKQVLPPDENQPEISKDFMLNFDVGLLYYHKKLAFRLGVNYFSDTEWQYPLSRTEMVEIKTPQFSAQLGVLYSFDVTKNNTQENRDLWNSYPQVSELSYDANSFGDFFIGAGPSQSFSLSNSKHNADHYPYLEQKISSSAYIDLALGYHFNKANLFIALSFRNPIYETEGYGTKQIINKTSLAIEINKFLTDYSGFAPYIGINASYDRIGYEVNTDGMMTQEPISTTIEPGLTFGWDIVPGKTNEALILRTNLRWYPFSEFEVNGEKFNFSQLEYNLIQVVFYPERLKKRK